MASSRHSDRSHERLALVVLCSASFMAVMDVSVVAVALPVIRQDLGFSVAGVGWVLNGYTLALGGLLLVAGRIGDVIGRRRLFLTGTALFGGCSVLGALAVSPAMLVAARVGQGVGAAALLPTALALLTVTFVDPRQRNRALGAYSAMAGLGFIAGVVAGGVATHWLGWRSVLLLNAPLAAALPLPALVAVPESRAAQRPTRLDLPGAMALAGGVALVIYGLVNAERPLLRWGSTIGPLAGGALLLGGFVAIERHSSAPLIPLPALRTRPLAAANAAIALKSTVGMAQLYVLTLFLQEILDATPLQTGLAFLPMAVASVVAALLAGRFLHRLGGLRRTTVLGCGLSAAGLAALALQLHPAARLGGVIVGMVIAEAGFMIAEVPLNVAASTALPRRRGLAAGMLNTATELGNALGLGVAAAVVAARSAALGGTVTPAAAVASGLRWALSFGIVAVVLAAVVAALGLAAAERDRVGPSQQADTETGCERHAVRRCGPVSE